MRSILLAAAALLLLSAGAEAAAIGHGLRFSGTDRAGAAPAPGTQARPAAEAAR